ncbi:hypothetical protein ULG90_12180 [Halopseudomonas pachastrellae]|nr:hypothetical protein ULG90_12180 [Halopseudomonas pachastrellae]
MLANFVEQMSYSGELTSWTVVVLGGEGAPTPVGDGSVTLMTRADKAADNAEKYSIGRLLSPKDEMLDLDESGWNAALEITRQRWRKDPGRSTRKTPPDEPAGPTIRLVKGLGADNVAPRPQKGLLIVSLLDPEAAGSSVPVVAFAISFPSSKSGKSVPYVTNSLWEKQYGASE